MTSRMTTTGIVITQGDTLNIPLKFAFNQGSNKVPVDLTNAVLRMQVRSTADGQPLIKKKCRSILIPIRGLQFCS